MPYLISIYKYINDIGLASQEENLFIHLMPNSISSGVLLSNPSEGMKINYEIKGYYNTEFRVVVRAEAYAAGNLLMQQISSSLTTSERRLEDIVIKQCYPYSESVSQSTIDSSLFEITRDFKIMFCEIAK
ncbi:minor capsid protein [Acinetobacter sp. A47]|uniref:phage tail terminator protein n=1 Tax=Acinetobacter sp. A47 TaxID=1561217 RepID=UPI00056E7B9E|nr:minor capsid protein [Acinetobacter sp. A47]